MTYILIIFYALGGYSMTEFSSLATCDNAAKAAIEINVNQFPVTTACVKK